MPGPTRPSGRRNTNSKTPSSSTYAVTPSGRPGQPIVRGLTREEALSAARDRNRRPSTRAGLHGRRVTVSRDDRVQQAVDSAGGLAAVKRRERAKREQSRRSSAKSRRSG